MVHLICAASCHKDCCSLEFEWFNSVVFCFSSIGCDLLTWTREREVFMYGGSYYVTRKQSKHSMASECVWANHNQENITSGLFAGQPSALDIYSFLKFVKKIASESKFCRFLGIRAGQGEHLVEDGVAWKRLGDQDSWPQCSWKSIPVNHSTFNLTHCWPC